MGQGTGANTQEAQSGGLSAEISAERIIGTSADFEDAIVEAKKAAGKTPGITGWSNYSEAHVDHIRDVEEQCMTIAGNTQSGAEEIYQNDQDSGGGISASGNELSRPVNGENLYLY